MDETILAEFTRSLFPNQTFMKNTIPTSLGIGVGSRVFLFLLQVFENKNIFSNIIAVSCNTPAATHVQYANHLT